MQDFRSLFILNPQPMLLYYPTTQRIGIANKAMLATYGYSENELYKMDLFDLEADIPNQTILFHTSAYEMIHQCKDGTLIQVEITTQEIVFDNKEAQLVLIRDVTNYKRQEEELRLAKQRTEEASQAKELFLASVSHEIRTPMNAIMGMSYLLDKTVLTPQQKTYIETIKLSADNLLIIINDILDMSKISAGKMTLECVGFSLPELTKNLCNTIRYRAEEKGIGLFTEIDRRISPILLGDPLRLYQILLNLVSNAIKFTDKGQVEIECKLVSTTQATNTIQFKVIDSGKGIDKENLEKIFEAFNQEDETVSRRYGGTGLGLSISKNLVTLFGSKLEVQSKKSTGTTFYFTLELNIGESEDLPQKEIVAKTENNLESLKILLVEDNEINLFVATSIMEQWGIKPDIAMNGKEAISKIKQNTYDIVFMDIQMPIMGGVEATKIIRKDIKSTVPIIALTANALKTDIDKYLAVGMNEYLSKPFEPSNLLRIILNTINKATYMEKRYNLPKLQELFSNNDAVVKKMLQLFIDKTPPLLEELQQAYIQGKYLQISKIAHKLKSSIKTLGASELGEQLQKLEDLTAKGNIPIQIESLLQDILQQVQWLMSDIRVDVAEK